MLAAGTPTVQFDMGDDLYTVLLYSLIWVMTCIQLNTLIEHYLVVMMSTTLPIELWNRS